jgi:hypothetical protein
MESTPPWVRHFAAPRRSNPFGFGFGIHREWESVVVHGSGWRWRSNSPKIASIPSEYLLLA